MEKGTLYPVQDDLKTQTWDKLHQTVDTFLAAIARGPHHNEAEHLAQKIWEDCIQPVLTKNQGLYEMMMAEHERKKK